MTARKTRKSSARPQAARSVEEEQPIDDTIRRVASIATDMVIERLMPGLDNIRKRLDTMMPPVNMAAGANGAPNLNDLRQASPAVPQRVDFYNELFQIVPKVYESWHQSRAMLFDANSKLDEASPLQPDYRKLVDEAKSSMDNYLSMTGELRRIFRIHG